MLSTKKLAATYSQVGFAAINRKNTQALPTAAKIAGATTLLSFSAKYSNPGICKKFTLSYYIFIL